jgi:hypothetical protein
MAGKRVKKRRVKKRPVKRKAVKKRIVKKRVAKKKVRRKPVKKMPKEKLKGNVIGVVTHYFPKVRAAAIKLKAPLSMGDSVTIKGHTTNFTQTVNSIQVDRQPITMGKRGQEIGLLVVSRVRRKDVVYKV